MSKQGVHEVDLLISTGLVMSRHLQEATAIVALIDPTECKPTTWIDGRAEKNKRLGK